MPGGSTSRTGEQARAGRPSHAPWRGAFGVDLRSLALMRILLGAALLFDLATRATQLTLQYTDAGLLPVPVLREHMNLSPLVVHALSGSAGFQAGLFALHAAAAACLLLGFHTRIAGFCAWLLVVSLQFRNPLLMTSADPLLRMLLFWGLFLPLGARFSIDGRRGRGRVARTPPTRVSLAGAALLIQVALVHLSSGLAKRGRDWRENGRALEWILSDLDWVRAPGEWLLAFPELLRALSFSVVGLEIVGALLLLCPLWNGALRALAVGSFLLMHAGIAATLVVGYFPLVSSAGLVGCVPTWLWERAGRLAGRAALAGARPVEPGGAPGPRTPAALGLARDAVVVAALAFVVAVNVSHWVRAGLPPGQAERAALPAGLVRALGNFGLYQVWTMFDAPRKKDVRFEYTGTTEAGQVLDLRAAGRGAVWDAFRAHHRDLRFRVGMLALRANSGMQHFFAPALAGWLCRTWNADPAAPRLVTVDLVVVVRELRIGGERLAPVRGDLLAGHPCRVATRGSSRRPPGARRP